MKKYYNIFIIAITAALLFCGCDKKNYADVSDNVKYVSAGFYLGEFTKDPETNLTKNAEVIYTKMHVVPKGNVNVTGISFDAKTKGNTSKKIFMKVYVTNCEKSLAAEEYKTYGLLEEYETEITDKEKTVTIIFDRPYAFDFTDFEKENSYSLCVEFLKEDKTKNTEICFSLNNVNLITAAE